MASTSCSRSGLSTPSGASTHKGHRGGRTSQHPCHRMVSGGRRRQVMPKPAAWTRRVVTLVAKPAHQTATPTTQTTAAAGGRPRPWSAEPPAQAAPATARATPDAAGMSVVREVTPSRPGRGVRAPGGVVGPTSPPERSTDVRRHDTTPIAASAATGSTSAATTHARIHGSTRRRVSRGTDTARRGPAVNTRCDTCSS